MITVEIPGSALIPLELAADQVKIKSHRGKLLARLIDSDVKRHGRGIIRIVEVPDGLVKELGKWVADAKQYAAGNTEREGLRRLRNKLEDLTSA